MLKKQPNLQTAQHTVPKVLKLEFHPQPQRHKHENHTRLQVKLNKTFLILYTLKCHCLSILMNMSTPFYNGVSVTVTVNGWIVYKRNLLKKKQLT